jgi:hypothetical protein
VYGILNEKQVGMGESTCASKLYAAPVGPSGGGKGKALFDISELSQIALERSSTAREAIQVQRLYPFCFLILMNFMRKSFYDSPYFSFYDR